MDDQKQEGVDNKVDDVMMPGFRFHPTDEELVAFYLKRKIQQRPLAIELIKQVDIYKYDPWDLSKMAATGEKEWYFYCPRDRKYRNSSRPNRVTSSGFWKATGTDRPIYTSDGTKCIGLKKSLVFYRGRAAKGIKTDWMMHEFRLPSTSDSSGVAPPNKKILDNKSLPPNARTSVTSSSMEAWAICRIFKKTNSIAQRALAHAWLAPFTESQADIFPQTAQYSPLISSENVSCTTESGSSTMQQQQILDKNDFQPTFSPLNIPSSNDTIGYKPSFFTSNTNGDQYPPSNLIFSQPQVTGPIYNLSHNFEHTSQQHFNNFFTMSSSPEIIQDGIKNQSEIDDDTTTNDQWLNVSLMGYPFSWNSPHCPSESNKYIHTSTEESNSPASQVFN